jgi:hypothetical protein
MWLPMMLRSAMYSISFLCCACTPITHREWRAHT